MNDNIYDSTLIKSITLANVFNYALSEPNKDIGTKFINDYISDNDITKELVELYISILFDLLDEMNRTDFDLQYGDNHETKKDTVFTLAVLDSVFDLKQSIPPINDYVNTVLLAQQATTNTIKYQCKYAIVSLQFLSNSMVD